ncbi:MAG TPA: secretin N-terminal domain-containing protein [Chthoniobacterales bacterium]|jgi:type II secretion system protein D
MAVLRFSWVLVLVSAATSLAQVSPAPPPPTRSPIVAPTGGAQDTVTLQYPNSDVQDVLRFYETLTGKRVIMDNTLQGKVNIFLTKPVTRQDAIKIIETNLALNGFSLVHADANTVEALGLGKNPRLADVPIISEEDQIPPGNQVISFLFRLQYADPSDVQQFLNSYFSGGAGAMAGGAILALPKSGSLIVTQSAAVVRAIAKIVDQIDVAPAEVVSEFISLQRADATKVVDMLKDILEKGSDQTRGGGPAGPGAIRAVRPNVPPVPQQVQVENDLGALTGLTEDSVVVGKVKISADVRTNRIHVITRPVNLPFIRKLIAELDANVEFGKPVTRPLRYISAGDVLPVLVQALTEPGQNEQGGAGGSAGPQAGPTPQRVTNPTVTNPYNVGQTSTASGSNLNVSEELSTQPVDTAPKAVTIGNTKIIADQRANTIIVLGNREVVVKVAKILDEMDVKAPQVALSTVIGELTLNNDEEFGVDWFLKYDKKVAGTSINIPQGTVPIPFPSGSPAASPGGSPGVGGIVDPAGLVNFANILRNVGSGTNVYVAAGNYLSAIVHAMESTGRFRVISRPMVFTSNNKKAIIANGQEVPVPVSTLSNVTNVSAATTGVAAVQSSIEYKKVALQLEVVPLINSEKEVSLDILQKIDSVVPNSNVNIGGNSVPTIATRYIRTNVSAPNCATIVLGGLITDNKQISKSGIPYLSRLPVVGPLFRMTTRNHDRTELIILMRPEVSLTKLDLYRLRQKQEDRTHFGPELEQEDCPDCPKTGDGKQLPPPDVPPAKG